MKSDELNLSEIADGIYRIETPLLTAQYPSVAYIIKDRACAMVDPSPSANLPALLDALDSLAIKTLDYILPTHLHMDHYGATGALSRLFPDAKVVVHPRYARHAIDPSRMVEAFKMVFGADFEARFGTVEPVLEGRLLLPKDGEVIDAGGRELEFIYTPGHAPHHLAIYDRKSCGLFCGEALGLPDFQLPAAPPMSFDLDKYIDTIEKLRGMNLGAEMVFVSHGTVERESGAVMSRAAENVRICSDIVLDGLRKNESPDAIGRRIDDGMWRSYGLRVGQRGIGVTVAGLSLYFKSKGMV